ncbi:MAG: hypothetical protein JWM59_4800 [Verrucomicrobiales bacterium]|nr:hypothetical protein [Verrucomicrobiales bacterium]
MNDPAAENPYAPPTAADSAPVPPEVAFIQKKSLVVPKAWKSPRICILTGKTQGLSPCRKRLLLANPLGVLIVLIIATYQLSAGHYFGVLFLAVALLILSIVRKRDFVEIYLNGSAARKHQLHLTIYWIMAGILLILVFKGVYSSPPGAALLVAMLLALGLSQIRSFRIDKIHRRRLWLSNIPPEIMRTIVRMDEEKAASHESWFPPPRF